MAVRKSKRGPVTLLERIDAFIDEEAERRGKERIDDKTFGHRFRNPRFLETLRKNGEPRRASIQACEDYMAQARAEWAAEDREKKAQPKRKRKRA